MILVDSSVWIAHFRNDVSDAVLFLRVPATASDILVGDLILLEILQGARDDAHAAQLDATLRAFPVLPLLNASLAVAAARNYRALRDLGLTVRKNADLIIATYCIEHGHALLQQDRDFEPFAAHLGLTLAA